MRIPKCTKLIRNIKICIPWIVIKIIEIDKNATKNF